MRRRILAATHAAALAAGVAIGNADPVLVDGSAPDGGVTRCHVEKTGFLQGQTVCDTAAAPLPTSDWTWQCSLRQADGGCAIMELAPPPELPDAGFPPDGGG